MIELRKTKGDNDKKFLIYGIYDKTEKIWYWFRFYKNTRELFDFTLYKDVEQEDIEHNVLVKGKGIRFLIKGIFKAHYGDIGK